MTYKEIDEMIKTVDENGDGKINYQVLEPYKNAFQIIQLQNYFEEFRVMIGAKPNLMSQQKVPGKSATVKGTANGSSNIISGAGPLPPSTPIPTSVNRK